MPNDFFVLCEYLNIHQHNEKEIKNIFKLHSNIYDIINAIASKFNINKGFVKSSMKKYKKYKMPEIFKLTLFKWDDEWISQGIKKVYVKLDKGNNIYNLHIDDNVISLDDVKRKNKIIFPLNKGTLCAIKKDEKLDKIIKKSKKHNKKQIDENVKELASMMDNL